MIKVEFDSKRACSRWLVQSLARQFAGVRLGPLFLGGRGVVVWDGKTFVADVIDNKTRHVTYRRLNRNELAQATMWAMYGTRPVRVSDGESADWND